MRLPKYYNPRTIHLYWICPSPFLSFISTLIRYPLPIVHFKACCIRAKIITGSLLCYYLFLSPTFFTASRSPSDYIVNMATPMDELKKCCYCHRMEKTLAFFNHRKNVETLGCIWCRVSASMNSMWYNYYRGKLHAQLNESEVRELMQQNQYKAFNEFKIWVKQKYPKVDVLPAPREQQRIISPKMAILRLAANSL